MKKYKLFDAEYRLADIIWSREPINSTELVKISQAELGWKKSTTYTVLRKLCEKGIMLNNSAQVSSIVKKDDVLYEQGKEMLRKGFSDSLPKFLTAFLAERKLSLLEAQELKKIIEEATDEQH